MREVDDKNRVYIKIDSFRILQRILSKNGLHGRRLISMSNFMDEGNDGDDIFLLQAC